MTARSEIGEWRWRPVSLENNQRLQVDAGGGVASEDEEENNSQLWLYFLSEPSRGHHSLILVFDVNVDVPFVVLETPDHTSWLVT